MWHREDEARAPPGAIQQLVLLGSVPMTSSGPAQLGPNIQPSTKVSSPFCHVPPCSPNDQNHHRILDIFIEKEKMHEYKYLDPVPSPRPESPSRVPVPSPRPESLSPSRVPVPVPSPRPESFGGSC